MKYFLSIGLFIFYALVCAGQTISPSGPVGICPGGSQLLSVTGGNPTSYQWKLNDTTLVGATATYTATVAGSYTVVLNGGGAGDTLGPIVVTIKARPIASFIFSPTTGCLYKRRSIIFTSTSTSNGAGSLTYSWNFGDVNSGSNNTSNNASPSHSFVGTGFSTPQNFTVQLTVTGSNGCSLTTSQTISVSQFPDATLTDPDNFPQFAVCGSGTFDLRVANSSTTNFNTLYQINWGDGSSPFSSTVMDTLTHTYPTQGYFNLQLIVSAATCKDTSNYRVYIGTNPGVGLSSNGSTILQCIPAVDTFFVSNTTSNPPGTTYTVSFNDGSPNVVFAHPPPSSFIHTFTSSSCGATGGITPNTFYVRIRAENPCGFLDGSVEPITTVTKPTADFSILPDTVNCTTTNVSFTNTSTDGIVVTNNGTCNSSSTVNWTISPATGWSITSGSSNTQTLGVNFNVPGYYSIRLVVRNSASSSSLCRTDTITKTICVQAPPAPSFKATPTNSCNPMLVNFTNTSTNLPTCGPLTRRWSVTRISSTCIKDSTIDYRYISGTDSTSLNPVIRFNNQGIYNVTLTLTNKCGPFTTLPQTFTVKRKPQVTLTVPDSICSGTIVPSVNASNCEGTISAYNWSFPGGVPSSSTLSSPPNITYTTAGSYNISVSVTNECGTTTVNKTIVIKPTPIIVRKRDTSFCAGQASGTIAFSSSVAGTTFSWTNSNTNTGLTQSTGTGNIPSFTTTNNSLGPITTNIIVTPTFNGCVGISDTFIITVNALPPAPTVTNISYCQGNTSIPLTATATGTNTLNWYTGANGGTALTSAPTPSTVSAGITNFYVSQTSNTTGCEGPRAMLTVTIKATPVITGTFTNPSACATSNGSITLSGLAASQPYQVSYIYNSNPVTSISSTSTAAGNILIQNLASGAYSNVTVALNGCPSTPIGPFNLSDPNPPNTPTASSNGPKCSGQTLQLNASTTSPGIAAYTWSGPNGFTSSLQNPSIANAATKASGTYTVSVTISSCTSLATTVLVQIDSTPAKPIISSNSPLCSDSTLLLFASTTSTMALSWNWTGPIGFSSTQQNPSIANVTAAASGSYSVIATATQGSCQSLQGAAIVTVNPTPKITGSSSTNPNACNTATGSIILNGLITGNIYTVHYTKNGSPESKTITAVAGAVTLNGLTAGAYTNVYVSINGCASNALNFSLSDPNPPATPVVANNGALCSGQTLNLTASTTSPGTAIYIWDGPNGFESIIQNPIIASATTAASGTYNVRVTINNCTSQTSATVVIVNQTPATPTVSSNSPVCSGNPLNLTASITGSPIVNWSWTGPGGYTSTLQNPLVSAAATTVMSGPYTVKATATYTNPSLSCPSAPASTIVTINPTPSINSSSSLSPVNCASLTGSITLNGLSTSTSYEVHYTGPAGPVTIPLTTNGNGTLIIVNLPAGSYSNVFVVVNNCSSAAVGPFSLTDPNPPATPVVANNGALCSGQTLNLTASTTSPGTAIYTWDGPNGFQSSIQNPIIASATTADSGTYNVRVTINNCTSQTSATVVIVNQTPVTPTVSSNSPVCSGNPLNLTASITGSPIVDWSWTGPGGYTSTLQNPLVSAAATTAMSGTYTVKATATYTNPSLSCPSAPASTIVTVNPTPSISSSSSLNPVNCASSTGSITLNGLSNSTGYEVHYTGPSGPVTIPLTTDGNGTLSIVKLPAGSYSNVFVVLNNCPSVPVGPFSLTDPNPPATPSGTSNTPVCTGESLTIAITSPIANAVYNWTGPNGFTNTGANITITNASVNATGTYNVSVTLNNCTSSPGSINAVVNPRPAQPIVSSPVVYCQYNTPTSITASALPSHTLVWYTTAAGGTGSNTAPIPSTSATGTVSYFVSQVTPENCEGPRAQIDVIVNSTPVVGPKTETICSSASFTISPSGAGVPTNTFYSWGLPIVTGGLTGAATGTNALSISGSLTNPTDFVQTATYRVQPISGNCPGDSLTVTISVNPAPHVNFSIPGDIICSGESSQVVNLSSLTPNAVITWSSLIPPEITGALASGTNQIGAQLLVNNTSNPLKITYAAIALTSGSSTCPGDTAFYNINVNPIPKISNEALTYCSRDTIRWSPSNNPPNTIVPPGTTYTWTVIDNSMINGESNHLTPVTTFNQVLVNVSNTPQDVVYTITPTSGSSGNCIGQSFQLTLTINPTPELTTYYDTICSEQSFSIIPANGFPGNSTIIPAGTTYSWNNPVMPGGTTGGQPGNNATSISGTLFNSNHFPVTVIYTVLPVSGNCAGDPFEVKVTVNPLASISNNPYQSVCNDGITSAVTWTSLTAGANYSWTLVSTGNITGASPSGSGNILPAMQLVNGGIAQDSLIYLITSTSSACAGPATPYTIYVNPDASANFSFTKDTACWPFVLNIQNISPNTANGSYEWFADGASIGTGYSFPGYTVRVSDTFVNIKLVALSLYGCVNDTIIHRFFTKNNPHPALSISYSEPGCGPLDVHFDNHTSNLTANLIQPFNYLWDFGNGQTSTLEQPGNIIYQSNPNFLDTTYYAKLTVFNECISKDTTIAITLKSPPKAQFAPNLTNVCSNTLLTYINSSLGIDNSYSWNFGDGSPVINSPNSNAVQHTYNVGVDTTFYATLTATNGCGTDIDTVAVRVTPSTIRLNWFITSSTLYGCAPHQVEIHNVSTGGTRFEWDFNDPNSPGTYTSSLNSETIYHTYSAPGIYNITVHASNACSDTSGVKLIRVIRTPIPAFQVTNNDACPWSAVQFTNQTDTATNYTWTFGDPASGIKDTSHSMQSVSHIYTAAGTYTVTLTASLLDISGVLCTSTVQHTVTIVAPIAQINAPPTGCIRSSIIFIPIINNANSIAAIRDTIWQINGLTYTTPPQSAPNFSHVFTLPGTYSITLIVGTIYDCYDTVSTTIVISNLPTITASSNQQICLGQSVQLNSNSNVGNYQWTPLAGLNCYTCSNPIASPVTTTNYVVSTLNAAGCTNTDTVLITVIQPFKISVSLNDTICIGESAQLTVSGASNYLWTPSATLSCNRCPNPVATPLLTTTYSVVGSDNFSCFTDTAHVVVVVGKYPQVTLPSSPILSTGTLFPIVPQITNGPIRYYSWTPSTNLNCDDCNSPVATIKKDICYTLVAENIYGCKGADTFCIKVFCENTQTFIPNTFTPDGDGINDILMVRATGIKAVKSFRVFNRWGEIVFERSNFAPNQKQFGWNGMFRGVLANPDVFVYTVEVLCENDVPFTYKGNVTLIR